ncbi:MarR family winged helix-turn-helix transcriptional regulator [Oceanicella sp. SM1341]|uniref:MarR family winged helix-turn-helix transcriptional regulator n=1 Tax=Oceanicella sp. SM1341 TaxID=1548889 RepID=UPI001E3C6493|nr:MarR family transcriptional regulator [Oceanicella sp. SM1341]
MTESDTMTGADEDAAVGAWAKRCYMAGRAVMDATLRPFDLGSTQWYVLWHLAQSGPTVQRDLGRKLELERATLSGIVTTLVRKDLVAQSADGTDQRQRLLSLTPAGHALWQELPDLTFIHDAAFGGADPADLETAARVLRAATENLQSLLKKD